MCFQTSYKRILLSNLNSILGNCNLLNADTKFARSSKNSLNMTVSQLLNVILDFDLI